MSRRGPAGPARLLCVDKPAGPTSFDVVRRVRRVSGQRRVGHGGTLDPFATGLVVVGLGPATRLLDLLARGDKVYHATIRFGRETDSCDRTGETVAEAAVVFDRPALDQALAGFVGEQSQVPPRLSAVRVEGQRSYRRARAGEDFEVPARSVTIHALEVLDFEPPLLELRVRCGGGTYIRSLARDLGRALGTRAHLEELRREQVGTFTVEEAVPLEELEDRWDDGAIAVEPGALVRHWPRLRLGDDRVRGVRQGVQPQPEWWADAAWPELPERVALLDHEERLVAVAERRGAALRLSVVLPEVST